MIVVCFVVTFATYYFLQKKPKHSTVEITQAVPPDSIRYIALGDSYTIGQGLPEKDSWPAQLVDLLNAEGLKITLVANPSRTGYSTQDLIDQELPIFDESNAQFVTVQIGVNDYVRGVPRETFQKNFSFILDHLLKTVSKDHILVVTIPDYSVTPYGKKSSNPAAISQGVQLFNTIITQETTVRNIQVVDVFTLSQEMESDATLIHTDGLHPSKIEYERWVKVIKPKVKEMLSKQERGVQ